MKILQSVFKSLKFWFVQSFIEIVIIVLLGYMGADVMGDFCKNCLLIENIESSAWGIGFKFLIFLLPYMFLFVMISLIPYFKKNQSNFKFALLNCGISCIIILLIGIIKSKEMLLPFLATLISSCIIIACAKFKATR